MHNARLLQIVSLLVVSTSCSAPVTPAPAPAQAPVVERDDDRPDSGGVVLCNDCNVRLYGPPPLEFGHLSSQIERRMDETLQSAAQVMKKHPELTLVALEGHADSSEQGAAGKRAYLLSRDRARAVKEALERLGVEASRLKVVPYGAEMPLIGPDQANRAPNRRVSFRILERSTR